MPVSVSNTAYGIINDAMHDAGLLQEGDEPTSEQLFTYMRRLCDVVNYLQLGGLKLFLLQEYSLSLVAGTNTYTVNKPGSPVPEKNLRIDEARIEDTDGNKRPIWPISWEEWNRLSTSSEGAIVGYLQDRQATSLNIKVWNTPDTTEAANRLILLVRTQVDNPINLETDVAFPQEWRPALRWGLADEISSGQPQTIMDRCAAKAREFKEALENWDVDTAETRFAPDFRSSSPRGFV